MKTTNWHDRYLVMYCDFLLYYEPRGNTPPRDFDKPVGALPLDRVAYKKIKDFEERMDVSGLIPKTIFYEHCFEVPVVGTDGKERVVLLQFDRAETSKAWREKLKTQAKNVEAMKAKIHPDLKNTIDVLMNKNPLSHRLKEAPPNGGEEMWITTLKGAATSIDYSSMSLHCPFSCDKSLTNTLLLHFFYIFCECYVYRKRQTTPPADYQAARNKYRKDLRRAQLFSDFYLPNLKSYIDWFVTSGGEAGIASLEKEIMLSEELVVNAWRNDAMSSLSQFENDVDELDKTNEFACKQMLNKAAKRSHLIRMYNLFHKELNPGRDVDNLEGPASDWKAFEDLLTGYIETIQQDRQDEQERLIAEHEANMLEAEADRLRREEERRNDPFGNPDDDDPFADTKVVGI